MKWNSNVNQMQTVGVVIGVCTLIVSRYFRKIVEIESCDWSYVLIPDSYK